MKRFMLSLGLLAAFTSAAVAQDATPHPVLKANVVVNGDLVRIGDVVDNAGIIAKVPIFRAPDLGMTGTVPAEAVAEAVGQYKLIGLDTNGISEVTVTRAARMIPAKAVEDEVARALSDQYQLGAAKDLMVTFDRTLRAMYVSPSALGEPRVTRISYDNRSNRFDADIDLPTGADSRGTLRLGGQAIPTIQVLVMAHSVERGALLKDSDIGVERKPRAEVSRDAITDRDQVVGLAARDSLPSGRPLRPSDLTRPELVQRNDIVTLTYDMPGLSLTVRGKATEGGAQGDTITVLNEQSKRMLQGVVIGPGRVAVITGTARLAANLPQIGGSGR
ncbi:MAG TPA: flagellar basal body P-ring formation chaperone FlgA [Pseudolabrys sp.]|jgi:flagella basal body P-ring formation protein FlgA|uniref:flagellar basal body P-ring formation chaperone FlgA n=1 Tax=Pseudolabrys sp. TaxID=1960880 RepID=UPI002DDC91F6|nr:flagellar basal body P-ring formation chaperone FlgA [Pseudolabrys sp.]HEV2629050.1 flagellar basal body P-ring formation chaperone FlgA [Pseudolabrys sp.]